MAENSAGLLRAWLALVAERDRLLPDPGEGWQGLSEGAVRRLGELDPAIQGARRAYWDSFGRPV